MIRRHALRSLIQLDAAGAPPTEFCLIPWGKSDSDNGAYIFDEKSSKMVMKAYQRRGVDCMIDYDHASLDEHPIDPRNARKAAGWHTLLVRPAVGLFATQVKWTPPALESFARKEFRYFSPAFDADHEGRVVDYINCALTNLPATHQNKPLIAASRKVTSMDPEDERRFVRLESRIDEMTRREEARQKQDEDKKKADEERAKLEAKKKARQKALENDDNEDENEEQTARHSRITDAELYEDLLVENARLRAGHGGSEALERRYQSLVSRGILRDNPNTKRFLLSRPAALDRIERELGSTEHREGNAGAGAGGDTHQMRLARQVGKAIGLSDEAIKRGLDGQQ